MLFFLWDRRPGLTHGHRTSKGSAGLGPRLDRSRGFTPTRGAGLAPGRRPGVLRLYICFFCFQGPIGLDGKPVSGPAQAGGSSPPTRVQLTNPGSHSPCKTLTLWKVILEIMGWKCGWWRGRRGYSNEHPHPSDFPRAQGPVATLATPRMWGLCSAWKGPEQGKRQRRWRSGQVHSLILKGRPPSGPGPGPCTSKELTQNCSLPPQPRPPNLRWESGHSPCRPTSTCCLETPGGHVYSPPGPDTPQPETSPTSARL